MGFAGGGGGVLTNHTHDTAITNDGGSLAANATQFGLSNQSMLVSDGSNIQELAVGSEGDNLGVTGGALTWGASVHSILADILVLANSTTIGDYTQPTSSTCSSTATGTLTPDWTWDGTATGWTLGTGCVIAASQLAITCRSDGVTASRNASRDLAADIGETWIGNTWVMRFKMSGTSLTNNNVGQGWKFDTMVADTTAVTAEDPASGPVYAGVMDLSLHASGGGTGDRHAQAWTNSATQNNTGSSFSNPVTLTWYVQLTNDGTNIVVKVYSDSGFSSLIESLSIAQTTASDLQSSLKYLVIRSFVQGITTASTVYVEDINFWNDVDDVVTSNPCSNTIDDDVATYWKSDTETNPNVYVDMSSATTTSNLALYPNAATTETEIKIQSSSNASDWTDKRTITFSNLTAGAWNYIRFNLVSARYWRIYGSSGSSYFLQIDEIKVLNSVSDADVRNLHGHRSISSSDTSLNNAGV